MFPPRGDAPFLFGRVVDMLYFPMFQGVFPDWVLVWGNRAYLFFRPVFNVADAAISVGVFAMLLFYRDFFREDVHAVGAAEHAKADAVSAGFMGERTV